MKINKHHDKIQCVPQKSKGTVNINYVANEPNLEGIAQAVDCIDYDGEHKDGSNIFNSFDDKGFANRSMLSLIHVFARLTLLQLDRLAGSSLEISFLDGVIVVLVLFLNSLQ